MKKFKKALIYIGLFVIFLLLFLLISNCTRPFIAVITQGMTHKGSNRIIAVVVCVPILASYFLVDFIKKKYQNKDR